MPVGEEQVFDVVPDAPRRDVERDGVQRLRVSRMFEAAVETRADPGKGVPGGIGIGKTIQAAAADPDPAPYQFMERLSIRLFAGAGPAP